MKELEYFFDTDNKMLLAYDEETEFFVKYIDSTNEWETCGISFMQFEHDYYHKSISESDALKISNGKSADEAFEEYKAMLENNLNGKE